MYLKELTINGFKSFAKKSGLEFKTPITAIVGPNGSGKSNVAESFRFVLGEQSTSKMRGKRGEDLIFSGSSSVSRSNRASVTITLANEKRVFPLDFDEIIIERVVHRDGSNEYLINGSRTRLKDVQSLLAAANIGSTGHHIISQGEADRILSANPKERREMIEDALGLKVYQYKKKESEQKLKKTLDNIAHVEGLRREVAPHLASLKRQVKKFEKAQELREELKGVYAEYLYREDVYLTHTKKTLTERKDVPTKKLVEINGQLAAAKERLQASAKDEKSDELMQLESAISRVRSERDSILKESGAIEGQVSFLSRRIEEAERKAAQVDETPIPYAQVKQARVDIEETVAQVSSNNDPQALQEALKNIVVRINTLLERAKGAGPDTSADQAELAELKRKQETLQEKLAGVSGEEEKLREQYEALKTSIEDEKSDEREAERKVFRLMNEKRELESVLERAEEDLRTLTRDTEEFEREIREAVALIRSAASAYKEFQVVESGVTVPEETIAHEERHIQRERRRQLERLKVRLEDLGQGSGDDILKEYTEAVERDEFLAREIEDLEQSVEKLTALIADLTKELDVLFVSGIDKIQMEFQKFFMLMFGGGEAKLLRVKPKVRKKQEEDEEIFEEEENEEPEGIEIDVKLPNKRVRGLDMLSGGERALTSIALIFAMSQVNPPLFIILDETDAALDEANSRRYGDMITALAEKSQLILITHNRETMGRAGVLYGVTMGGDGVSKLLSIEFDEAVQVAK